MTRTAKGDKVPRRVDLPAGDRRHKMAQMWRDGMKIREIAVVYGLSIGYVGRCLKRAGGHQGRSERMKYRMLAAWGMHHLGKDRHAIASALGISYNRAKTYLWLARREGLVK